MRNDDIDHTGYIICGVLPTQMNGKVNPNSKFHQMFSKIIHMKACSSIPNAVE